MTNKRIVLLIVLAVSAMQCNAAQNLRFVGLGLYRLGSQGATGVPQSPDQQKIKVFIPERQRTVRKMEMPSVAMVACMDKRFSGVLAAFVEQSVQQSEKQQNQLVKTNGNVVQGQPAPQSVLPQPDMQLGVELPQQVQPPVVASVSREEFAVAIKQIKESIEDLENESAKFAVYVEHRLDGLGVVMNAMHKDLIKLRAHVGEVTRAESPSGEERQIEDLKASHAILKNRREAHKAAAAEVAES